MRDVHGLEELLRLRIDQKLISLRIRREDISAARYRNSLTSVFPIVENLMDGFGKRKWFPLITCRIDQHRSVMVEFWLHLN